MSNELPTWEQMSDLDKGAALVYLSKACSEGYAYAREHYPARYLESPALKGLDEQAASEHAESLFEDDIDGAYDALGEDELDRLYDLALAAEQSGEATR